jgi:Skp family chaperone for outer membrane proteins
MRCCVFVLMLFVLISAAQAEDAKPSSESDVKQWLIDLRAEDFAARNVAEEKLTKAASAHLELLRAEKQSNKDAEVQTRLNRILLRAEVGPIGRVDINRVFVGYDKVKNIQSEMAKAFSGRSLELEKAKGKLSEEDYAQQMKALQEEIEKMRCAKIIEVLKDISTAVADVAKAGKIRVVVRADEGQDTPVIVPEVQKDAPPPTTATAAVKEFGRQPILFRDEQLQGTEWLAAGKTLDPLIKLGADITDDVIKSLNEKLRK